MIVFGATYSVMKADPWSRTFANSKSVKMVGLGSTLARRPSISSDRNYWRNGRGSYLRLE